MPGGGDNVVYSDGFIAKLELLWGEGFLSPGGPEEIAEMFLGLDLTGARVLNIGCGLGAMDLILARDFNAARVLGIDIEAHLIARAQGAAKRRELSGRVSFRLVAPGPLPFPDNSFDVVTSKDAIISIPDKAAIYAEALRVLAPGGRLIVSDWFGGLPPGSDDMRAWMDSAPGHYYMTTLDDTARLAGSLGFTGIETRDRHAWYAEMTGRELAGLRGAGYDRLVALCGAQDAEAWRERIAKKAAAVAKGDLRPGHLRARKWN